MWRVGSHRLTRVLATAGVGLLVLGLPIATDAEFGGNNRGDVWVDNVGQPSGPGDEMNPHLGCADINLWGKRLEDPSGTYTVAGWPPSGSKEQDYPASGQANWTYNRDAGGRQVIDVISVKVLIANAIANGDIPKSQKGFHFKLQFTQDPHKHKEFWVSCPVTGPAQAHLVVQTIDSCRQAVGVATIALRNADGTVVETEAGYPGGPTAVFAGGGCPTQAGDCVNVPVGCATFTLDIPTSGTNLYTLIQTAAPMGYVPCEGGSACRSETMTVTVGITGNISATTTNVYPDGFTQTFPISDPHNGGAAFWTGAQSDPALFYDERLGTVSCDDDSDADDLNTGPGTHCDYDGPNA